MPDLLSLAREALIEELPGLLGRLAEAEAVVRLRLSMAAGAATTNRQECSEAERLLTPEEAAGVAHVPVSRIYQWARDARWASRPTRRCLRIGEQGFRRWLASKGR